MIKPSDPRQLALDIMGRSICAVQVGAVLADRWGIFAWGWNSVGSGFGEHAEASAIRRGSRDRMVGATIYIASQRRKKPVLSKPCEACMRKITNRLIEHVIYLDSTGKWIKL